MVAITMDQKRFFSSHLDVSQINYERTFRLLRQASNSLPLLLVRQIVDYTYRRFYSLESKTVLERPEELRCSLGRCDILLLLSAIGIPVSHVDDDVAYM